MLNERGNELLNIHKITIIICTCNRARSLYDTLESLKCLTVADDLDVELLIVDNNSTDNTRFVAEAFCSERLKVRYVFESKAGVAFARNTGVRVASGEVVVFVDDDVRTPPEWLEGMCRPILSGTADAVQGGVRLAAHLERPWLKGALRTWLAAVEHPTRPPEGMVSANFMFRRRISASTMGFDTRLGPGAAGFFEDTVFGWQLIRAGVRIAYRPDVYVEHHFDPSRLAWGSFMSTARKMAASRALVVMDGYEESTSASVLALLAEVPGFFARSITQVLRLALDGRPDRGFLIRYYRIRLWFALRSGGPPRRVMATKQKAN